jgi:hypothetical protein
VPDGGASLPVFAPTLDHTGFSKVLERLGGAWACLDDSAEPDDPSDPRMLDDDTSGRICGSKTDYFAIAGQPGNRTSIALNSGDDADIDMDLLDASGALIRASRGIGSEEWLEVALSEDDPDQLRVFSFDHRDAD